MSLIDESLDDRIEDAIDAAAEFLNTGERSTGHVFGGIIVTVGFALLATAIASGSLKPKRTLKDVKHRAAPVTERPRGAFSLILPAVFSATTLSAVRVWNAPTSRERSFAMGLWFAAQTVNAVWLGLRPSSRRSQIAAAMSTAGLAAAFAHEARKLDEDAGKMAAPNGMGVRLANMFERRRETPDVTLH